MIQPMEIGAVRTIHVKNGQFVKKGDLLIELDPTLANADEAQSTQTLLSAQIIQGRNDALLAHLAGRRSAFKAPPGTPAGVAATEQAFIRDIEIRQADAQQASAAVGRLDAELRSLSASFGKIAVTDLAEANDRASLAGEELRKAVRRRQFQELRAPVDGVVQQLAITTVGGVVQPAQALMVIVPCKSGDASKADSCNSGVSVEAFVQNKDIGFVKEGQRVAVKLEAFNFTDYGLIEGTVANISRDAIDQSQQPAGSTRDANGRPVQPGLVYAARITLPCAPADPDRAPLCDRVQPGMAVQAEIKTGKRRIIQYLLSPISQAMNEAGRER